jgi:hypothetical protein
VEEADAALAVAGVAPHSTEHRRQLGDRRAPEELAHGGQSSGEESIASALAHIEEHRPERVMGGGCQADPKAHSHAKSTRLLGSNARQWTDDQESQQEWKNPASAHR